MKAKEGRNRNDSLPLALASKRQPRVSQKHEKRRMPMTPLRNSEAPRLDMSVIGTLALFLSRCAEHIDSDHISSGIGAWPGIGGLCMSAAKY